MNDPITRLTPEEKLLLSLCRLDFSEEKKSGIRNLMKEVKDWDHFAKMVNNHGIIAITAFNIRETGLTELVPGRVIKFLENGRHQSMIRNTWLVQRWKEVNKILSEEGIKHILLKGMALEHTIYGARGLRPMTDNDILVKEEDALKTWLLLQEHGFQSDIIKSPLHRKIITGIGKHLPTLVKDGYAVEIHNRLFRETEMNGKLNNAIDNAIEIDVEGTKAFIVENDIHLDFLKEHLQNHLVSGDAQLRLYLDIELFKPGSSPPIPDGFLTKPDQSFSLERRKEAYRANLFSIQKKIRFRYLCGDIFPSLKWMKKRHGCGTVKALFLYPGRLGKVLWLFSGKA